MEKLLNVSHRPIPRLPFHVHQSLATIHDRPIRRRRCHVPHVSLTYHPTVPLLHDCCNDICGHVDTRRSSRHATVELTRDD